MQSNTLQRSHSRSHSTIMHWTQPISNEQRRYYSNFSAVLAALTFSRRVVQLAWMLVAAAAMAYIVHEAAQRFVVLPYGICFAVSLGISAVLHRLLSETTKAHYYDKWDSDPQTNSGLVAPIIIALFLVTLEYKALNGWFVSKIDKPTEITDTAESDYNANTATAIATYNAEKQRITENYNERALLISPTLTKRLESLQAQRKRAKNTADRDYLKALIAKTESEIEANTKLKDLRTATEAQLSTLLIEHQAELKRLQAKRDKKSEEVAAKNGTAQAEYSNATLSASGYAGAISIFCMAFFFFAARNEVRIKTRSGIFPIRHFSELDAHGNPIEKAVHVFGDIFKRTFHHTIYSYHRRASKSLGELQDLDGRLNVTPGNYQSLPKQNGNHVEWDARKKN